MSELVPQFDSDKFEALCKSNGFNGWYASQVMATFGYSDSKKFSKAINAAQRACLALEIDLHDNFERVRFEDGSEDFKLSRFAVYLTVMNGDPSIAEIAAAQAYFALIAEAVRQASDDPDKIDRVVLRKNITDQEKTLSGVVKKAEVENYAFFQNAGYRGMYNMTIAQLRKRRGLGERSPLDFMGKAELAANLFRITQTEERIRSKEIKGQAKLEATALDVGKKVRETMIETGGTAPENLPIMEDIKKSQSSLKKAKRELEKVDKKKNSKK
ncbi:MAG: hypothetical protein ACKVQS_06415 [Fimbriimonadaceae bacterium]